MIGKIIAFGGIHSSGKTTGVFEMVAEMKKLGINAWPIVDVARTARLPINEKGSWVTQEVIAHRMGVQLLEAAAKHEVVVSDRTMLDCLAYGLAIDMKEDSPEYIRLKSLVYNFTRAHNSLVYQLMSCTKDLKADGTRSLNTDYYEKSMAFFNKIYNQAKEDMPEITFRKSFNFKHVEVRKEILNHMVEWVRQ